MSDVPSYKVALRNSGVTLDVRADQPIYKAALAAGIQLPIGCDYGGCITCAAKLIEGSVRQPGASALNKRQSKAGYILLCVARPKTDCVIEDGVESHDELYQNPFSGKLSLK
ncbi:MAG: 2Fe-2S iron-sulfur cluster binding domain-containing protein [Gammaproteobacteria bacterium]|nr:2Fe-2S iron-sulfur cluster binding domain-containing protein [Gammaproteobacteria bacterium]